MRHPGYLAGELVLATLILLLTGVNSPFFYYTLGSALLGGLVYGWAGAGLFSVMLIGVYAWVVSVRDADGAASFVLPALYPLIAAAGAGLRGLLDRQAATESELASQSERARLARDMHDSLAKTVSGMGFAALALARHIERDPATAATEARKLAEDARQATREAREIIVGLRADAGEQLPLTAALEAEARAWGETSGVRVALAVEEVGELHAVAERELEWILREALRNIERHAGASAVTVRLRRLGGRAVLTVADDGAGFEVPDELEELAKGRHFGVTGMRERAQLAGGELSVESAPGDGCVLSVWMPAEAPPAAPPPGRRAAGPGARRPGGYAPVPLRPRLHMAIIRILLVDDNAIVRRGIASLLAEADGLEVVGEAADGREAIALAEELRPDVVCLDVRMPVMDGVAAAGPLAQRSKVLMLSYSEDEHLVTGAIRNGAAGYLVHGRFEPDELEGRIKAVARGEMVLSPAVTPAVFDVLRRSPGVANDEDELGLGSLTAREREVLNLLARGNTNREIAEQLFITNKTVKNHLSRIYEKIGVHSRSEAIALWLGVRDCQESRRIGCRRLRWAPKSQGVPRGIGTPCPPQVETPASRRAGRPGKY